MKTGSIEMTAKKAKPNAAEPNYVLKPKERDAADKALSRMVANTAPPLKIVNNEISIDHPNAIAGKLLMMEALGTGDQNFADGIVRQLANASGSPGRSADEANLNFMLSVVVTIKPNDEVEAMIGAQMAVIQSATMKAAQRLASADNLLELESAERTFNKLVRSFAALVETLKRYRAGSEQNVTVQNVSVGSGGQAIVGNFPQNAPALPTDKSAVSPAAITDARVQPMEIIGKAEQEVIPANPKSTS
jgi:hypothetical protein